MGTGLVGTQGSTMSQVAGLRVEKWNGGVAQYVSWMRRRGEEEVNEAIW